MFSRPLAFVLLALGCVTAAAGGAYVATRHHLADTHTTPATVQASAPATPATPQPAASSPGPTTATKPVRETDAPVAAPSDPPEVPKPAKKVLNPSPGPRTTTAAKAPQTDDETSSGDHVAKGDPPPPRVGRTVPHDPTATLAPDPTAAPLAPPPAASDPVKPVDPPPDPPAGPQFDEVMVPAFAVIGLQIENGLSSERSRLEDRVTARVTRDVMANGRVAIPVGSRITGSVVAVYRGGKVKDPAHLAIRFHTLVLADGSVVQLRTETIDRYGEDPTNDSSKKIGGAAIVGGIIGGLLGGGKGALIGGTMGAGAGTAATMAGDRNPAIVPAGSTINVRLAAPVTLQIERR